MMAQHRPMGLVLTTDIRTVRLPATYFKRVKIFNEY